MTRTVRGCGVFFLSLALVVPSLGQQPPIKIKTNEVLLDVVVVDKKGRPVRDLRADEVEILEDGVPQALTLFRAVSDALSARGSSTDVGSESKSKIVFSDAKPLHLVTMLFDHLSVQRVQPVRDAAFQFIDNSVTDNMQVRVMVIGRKLYLIEQFTGDKEKLRRAVERATYTVEKAFEERSRALEKELEASLPATETSPSDPAIASSAQLARMSLDTLRGSEQMSEEVKSPHHVFSLIPFARSHRLAPGRKMALYFSDGLYMPPGMSKVMQTAISESTRANLSFYSINIRDLLVGAGNQVSRLETATVVNQTRRAESAAFSTDNANSFNVYRGSDRATTNFNTFEFIERKKEMGKQGPLSELTEGTGGFLITNTNDLNGALKRIGSEMGNYYAVSYQPSRQETDGKFRSITVKVKRSGAIVKTRQGYFALPDTQRYRPELSYETPLLAALNGGLTPHDFPLHCAAYHFEARANKVHVAVNAAVPLAPLIHQEEKESKAFPVSFAVLGLVKDEKGDVIQQFSEPHVMSIPRAAVEEARRSGFNLTRHFWLPPGRYTIETAAHDQQSSSFSADRRVVTISPHPHELQISNLLLVEQVEEVEDQAEPDHPLVVRDKRIVPHLTDTFAAAELKDLSFALAIFPGAGAANPPTLTIELRRGEQVLAKTSPALEAPDETGRIVFTAGLGAEGLTPGSYILRAIVAQGDESCEETISFTIIGEAKETPAAEEKVIAGSLTAADKVGELTLHALKTFRPLELSTEQLIEEVLQSGERMDAEIDQYTYSLRKVRRILNTKGQIRQEEYQDFEAYPVKGRHALIKFADNGSRLALPMIELNRKVATDILAKSEETQTPDRQIGYWGASLEGISQRRGQPRRWLSLTIDPETFLHAWRFSSPRVVMLEGRETVVLDFQPNDAVKLNRDEAWSHRLAGTLWIDLADKALVRIEGQNRTTPSELINFVYQQQRLAKGVWAPSLIRLNSGGDETLFEGFNWDAWFEFTQFKRFDTREIEHKIITPETQRK